MAGSYGLKMNVWMLAFAGQTHGERLKPAALASEPSSSCRVGLSLRTNTQMTIGLINHDKGAMRGPAAIWNAFDIIRCQGAIRRCEL